MTSVQSIKIDLFQNTCPNRVLFIGKCLLESGFEVYLVGGAVRDILIFGKDAKAVDYDFTTNATPDEVIRTFKKCRFSNPENINNSKNDTPTAVFTIPTGLQHGTVTVVVDQEHFEITTYRIDIFI